MSMFSQRGPTLTLERPTQGKLGHDSIMQHGFMKHNGGEDWMYEGIIAILNIMVVQMDFMGALWNMDILIK